MINIFALYLMGINVDFVSDSIDYIYLI